MAVDIKDLDPVFNLNPITVRAKRDTSKEDVPEIEIKGTSTSEKKGEGAGPDIKDLDDVFAINPNDIYKENSPAFRTEPPTNAPVGAGAGAVAGYIANKVFPEVKEPTVRGYDSARINAELANKTLARQTANLETAKQAHVSLIDQLYTELNSAKAEADLAAQRLNQAKANALKLNVMPEAKLPNAGELLAGDKWANKVTGGMGPGGDSVTEAARNYRVQQGLSPSEAAHFQANRAGIIVPNEVKDVVTTNPLHEAARQELSEAQALHEAAQKRLASTQAKWNGMSKATPRAVSSAERTVASAAEKAASASDRLALLNSQKPSTLGKAGYIISKIPGLNVLSGALSGAEFVHGAEQWNKGNYGQGALGMMGGVGGGLMMLPHPYAKAAGALLSVPPLTYQLYKGLTD